MSRIHRERTRAIALRLRESVVAWLWATARRDGHTVTAFVRDLIEDARTTSGLPPPVADLLREEAATLGFPWRLYVQHVLYRRSELVRARGPAFDSLAPAPSARPRPGRRAS